MKGTPKQAPPPVGRARAWTSFLLVSLCATVLCAGCAPETQETAKLARLFNGRDLTGWQVLDDGYFTGAGEVCVRDGRLVLGAGKAMTGVRWTGAFPHDDYEVTLDGMRVDGSDFFCGMTFPVAAGYGTLILGGWGGSVVGISNVNGMAADENETSCAVEFKNKRWYRIQLLVTGGLVDVWLDDEKVIQVKTAGKKFAVWPQQEDARPFGLTTWYTTGALKNITLRRLGG